MNRWAGFIRAAFLVLAIVATDQVIKYLVETRLPFQQMVEVIPFLALFRTHNTGMAFSMLDGFGPWVLILLALCVATFVGWLWSMTPVQDKIARLGFALILGGAIGNLTDRIYWGHVVDYVLFHTQFWSFAIFNLADAAISVGAGFVILQEIHRWYLSRGSENENSSEKGD